MVGLTRAQHEFPAILVWIHLLRNIALVDSKAEDEPLLLSLDNSLLWLKLTRESSTSIVAHARK